MSQFFDQASLVMIPSGYKTGKVYSQKPLSADGELTFTRSNDTATRVGSDGLIQRVRTNYLLHSGDLTNAVWLLENSATIASGTTDPDGGSTSFTLSKTAAAYARVRHNITWSGNNSFNFWVKAGTLSKVTIQIGGAVSIFDLDNKFFTTNALSSTFEEKANGWFLINSIGASPDVRIYPDNYNVAYAGNILIWHPQLEQGDIATDWIETTTAAVSVGPVANLPRLDYLGSSCGKLLLEPQRTNLITYSEQFTQWATTNITLTENFATSPDGYQNADKFALNASSDSSSYKSVSGTSAIYSLSVFAKYVSGGKYLYIFSPANAEGAKVWFDIEAGTVANQESGFTGAVQDYGNGWYRCTLTNTSNKSLNYMQFGISSTSSSRTLSASSVTYFYGAQVEAGAYATSYIPTLGASVTRGADAAYKTGISSLIGQTEGTIYWEGTVGFNDSEVYVFLQNTLGSGITDSIFIQLASGVGVAFNIYDSTTQVVNIIGGTYTIGQTLKIAAAYKLNDVVLYVNGVQIGTDTSAAIPATTSMQLGAYPASPTTELYMSDNVKQTLLFKTRLTNAQLAELTTI
jgi:hypothetical protein